MRITKTLLVLITLGFTGIAGAGPIVKSDLTGAWDLVIEDKNHEKVLAARIHFTAAVAESCKAGRWKKVKVEGPPRAAAAFFPIGEALSYQLAGDKIIIGRNGICDAYAQLEGEIIGAEAHGDYVSFGIDGSEQLGFFVMTKRSAGKQNKE